MIINKDTSDSLLVNSIRIFGEEGKPVVKAKTFNTDTLEVVLYDDSIVACTDFSFFINIADEEDVVNLVGEDFKTKVVPGHKTSHGQGPASMVYDSTDPDYLLVCESPLGQVLLRCSNCSTRFVAFLDRLGNLWGTERVKTSDKYLTATKLEKDSLTCDSCQQKVTFSDD